MPILDTVKTPVRGTLKYIQIWIYSREIKKGRNITHHILTHVSIQVNICVPLDPFTLIVSNSDVYDKNPLLLTTFNVWYDMLLTGAPLWTGHTLYETYELKYNVPAEADVTVAAKRNKGTSQIVL